MKKYIVLSVNGNPDYLYYTQLTCWAWRQFGWEPIVMFTTNKLISDDPVAWLAFDGYNAKTHIHWVNPITGYRTDTISQVSRLYVASVEDGYLMTGDIDMLPLSDYWKFDENAQTVWGHDLTGFGHYPICYIGMKAELWKVVMRLGGIGGLDPKDYNALIKRDLKTMPQAKDSDFYKYWFTDQDLITQRLKPFNPVTINRGQYSNGFAVGRVDRGAWSLNHSQFIDCHMFQQLYHKNNKDKFDKTMELLTSIWPDEDFGWFLKYTDEFRKLTGHA